MPLGRDHVVYHAEPLTTPKKRLMRRVAGVNEFHSHIRWSAIKGWIDPTAQRTLEVGSGEGLVTVEVARMVAGSVLASEFDPRLIDMMRLALAEAGVGNVETSEDDLRTLSVGSDFRPGADDRRAGAHRRPRVGAAAARRDGPPRRAAAGVGSDAALSGRVRLQVPREHWPRPRRLPARRPPAAAAAGWVRGRRAPLLHRAARLQVLLGDLPRPSMGRPGTAMPPDAPPRRRFRAVERLATEQNAASLAVLAFRG